MSNMFKKGKGSISLNWYRGNSFLWHIVQWIIDNGLSEGNDGKFKEGDVVRYNWKAKVQLKQLFDNGWCSKGNLMVTQINYSNKSGIEYKTLSGESGSTCAFWVRKAYWWEL